MTEEATLCTAAQPVPPPMRTKIVLVGGTNDAQRLRWEHDFLDAIADQPLAGNARTIAIIGAAGRSYMPDAPISHDIVARAETHPTCICCPDGKIVVQAGKIIAQNPGWLVIEVLTPLLMLMRNELQREFPAHPIATVMIKRSMRATSNNASATQGSPLWDILDLVDFNVIDDVSGQRAISSLIENPMPGTSVS